MNNMSADDEVDIVVHLIGEYMKKDNPGMLVSVVFISADYERAQVIIYNEANWRGYKLEIQVSWSGYGWTHIEQITLISKSDEMNFDDIPF